MVVIPDPDHPEVQVVRFTGRIDSSVDTFTEGNADIVTEITAIDALGDLHDHNPVALEIATGVQSTSERVTTVLDRMEWPEEKRQIQPGFHTMQTSFLAQTSLEEVQRAADAEGGALYANGDGVVVFKNRDWLISEAGSVAFDAATENVGTGTRTFNHTPTGTPQGVIVFTFNLDSPVHHEVTYGGLEVPELGWDESASAHGGSVHFLENIPSGTQEVVVSGGSLGSKHVVVVTVTASGDLIVDGGAVDGVGSDPLIDWLTTAVPATRFFAYFGTGPAVGNLTPESNQTAVHDHDWGTEVSLVAYESTPTTAPTIGWEHSGAPAFVFPYIALSVTNRSANIQGYIGYGGPAVQGEVEYLIVAGGGPGGGGGGSNGGSGGGAGGVVTGSGPLPAGSYPVTVGAGGTPTNNGSDSEIDGLAAAAGGGRGGRTGSGSYNATSGGSGGGAQAGGSPGSGVAGQGHAGGEDSSEAGGGGGGAGEVGEAGGPGARDAGDGGDGVEWPVGSGNFYGGGGGGSNGNGGGGGYVSAGGLGGGGRGHSGTGAAESGVANTGGGGGGSRSGTPGSGGSGIVIVRYLTGTVLATGGSVTTEDGYTYHTFTSSGTLEVEANPGAPEGSVTAEITDTIRTPWELQRVRNDVQFARDGGVLQQVEDSPSQSAYGVRSYSRRDFHNNDDAEVLELAERNLAAYKDARPRLEPITIVANDDPDNEDLNRLFWDSRFGDLVSVKVQTLHGWGYSREAHIIGITDELTAEEWRVTFALDDSIIAVLEEED